MGLALHYSGSIRNPESIQALSNEVADICRLSLRKETVQATTGRVRFLRERGEL